MTIVIENSGDNDKHQIEEFPCDAPMFDAKFDASFDAIFDASFDAKFDDPAVIEQFNDMKHEIKEQERVASPSSVHMFDANFDDHFLIPVQDGVLGDKHAMNENDEAPSPRGVHLFDSDLDQSLGPACPILEDNEQPKYKQSNDVLTPERLESDTVSEDDEVNFSLSEEESDIDNAYQYEHVQDQEITYLEKSDQDIRIDIRVISNDIQSHMQPAEVEEQKKSVTFFGSDPVSERNFYAHDSIPNTPSRESLLTICTNRMKSVLKQAPPTPVEEHLPKDCYSCGVVGPLMSEMSQWTLSVKKSASYKAFFSKRSSSTKTANV